MLTIEGYEGGFPVTPELTEKLMRNVFSDMAAAHRRLDLMRSNPTPLDDPVWVEIDTTSLLSCYGSMDQRDLDGYISELRDLAAHAPDGCSVTIEYEREGDYDGPDSFNRVMGYFRPPTEDELAERKERNAAIEQVKAEAVEEAAIKERAEFERLREKFASDSDTRPKDGDAKQGSTRE